MTPSDTQVGDQWGELERLAKAAHAESPAPWSVKPRSRGPHGNLSSELIDATGEWIASFDGSEEQAFSAAANPAAVLELIAAARSVGTKSEGRSEQKDHPIRGEGEPVGWMWRTEGGLIKLTTWQPERHDADALYAHPPTTYEGEGLREALEIIDSAPVLVIDRAVARMRDDKAALEYAVAVLPWAKRAKAFLQALQSAGRES